MNRPPADLPEPLLAADASDFERRLLESARQKGPSPAASARMARALGVTAAVAATGVAAKTLAAEAAASKATVAAGASTVWPWISAGVIGLAVAGAVIGTRVWHASPPAPRPVSPSVAVPTPPPAPSALPEQPGAMAERPPSQAAATRRTHGVPIAAELRDQIEFIDAARAALSVGADRRALELVGHYQEKYPAGSFRPEATALRVEALMKIGREAEARALAERFVAEHRGSLLATRVAEIAGLAPK